VRANPGLIGLSILGFATTFFGNPVLTFLPLFTQNVLGGDVNQYTRLMAAAGGGAVTGALIVAWLGKFRHMGRTLLAVQFLFGVLVVLFAITRLFWLNAILMFAAGACMVMVFAMLSSLVQLNAPNEMRGRVMSIYMVAFRRGLAGDADERAGRTHLQWRAPDGRGGMVPAQGPRCKGAVDELPHLCLRTGFRDDDRRINRRCTAEWRPDRAVKDPARGGSRQGRGRGGAGTGW
jgi:hypothetical protein